MAETDIVLDEKITKKTKIPSKYKVIFLNDDVTPMEWVVDLLQKIYRHSRDTAEKITMQIHHDGSGCAGVYAFQIAEQKAQETLNISHTHGFPLRVKVEEE